MQIEKQFNVAGINRPAVLANITRALADKKINIKALIITHSKSEDVMRMVVDKPDSARTVLSKIDAPVSETNVISVEIPNRPGAFSSLVEKLSRAHINIECAYCTTGGPSGRATAVFQVSYMEQAKKIILEATERRQEKLVPNLRAPQARR
ncbi:MAG: hypothetical protein QME51_11670 [Planctomycetota bacterium]|nr:hypothetical protein [Planctomycetota bacterium]